MRIRLPSRLDHARWFLYGAVGLYVPVSAFAYAWSHPELTQMQALRGWREWLLWGWL